MKDLPVLLDRLEQAGGPADPVPSADGWELVLAENIAYLVDDRRRWQALARLRTEVGLAPEQILAAPEDVLRGIVAGPARRNESSACAGARSLPSPGHRGAPTRASGSRERTALTCSQGPGPSLPSMLTACECWSGWASATRHAPMQPATGRLRPRPASACLRP